MSDTTPGGGQFLNTNMMDCTGCTRYSVRYEADWRVNQIEDGVVEN
jgi:hypothetical protein